MEFRCELAEDVPTETSADPATDPLGATTIFTAKKAWSCTYDFAQRPRKLADHLAASRRVGEAGFGLLFPVLVSKAGRPTDEVLRSAVVTPLMTLPPRAAPGTRPLADEILRLHLGRTDDSDIIVDDSTVSRRHAAIVRRRRDRWSIVDEGSLNGTFLDGQQLEPGSPEDIPGDPATIGIGPRERFFFFRETSFHTYLRTLQASYSVAWPTSRQGRASRSAARPSVDPLRSTAPLSAHQSLADDLMGAGIIARVRAADVACDTFSVVLEGALVEEFESLAQLEPFVRANVRRILTIEAWRAGGLERTVYRRPGLED